MNDRRRIADRPYIRPKNKYEISKKENAIAILTFINIFIWVYVVSWTLQ